MRKTAVLVAALLVVAGCNAAPAAETPENPQTTVREPTTVQSPSSPVNVTEQGASLGSVNATAVWQRVGTLVSVDLPADPPRVQVRSRDPAAEVTPSPFFRAMGAENYSVESTVASGQYMLNGTVVVWRTANSTDAQVESTLAHEFAHAVQFRQLGGFPSGDDLATKTVVEGGAAYLEWLYADRYGTFDRQRRFADRFQHLPSVGKLYSAPYYLGPQWVRNHSGDAPLAATYRNSPSTAEQVLHGLPPGSEGPRRLTVDGESGEYGVFLPTSPTRRGEAVLRFLLEYGLTREQAAVAAAGWGNDRLLTFQSVEGDGWAWVVRWDSPRDTREFEALFADFRANLSEPLGLRTVGDETTVVLAGRAAFVENATATGTAENVTVTAGD